MCFTISEAKSFPIVRTQGPPSLSQGSEGLRRRSLRPACRLTAPSWFGSDRDRPSLLILEILRQELKAFNTGSYEQVAPEGVHLHASSCCLTKLGYDVMAISRREPGAPIDDLCRTGMRKAMATLHSVRTAKLQY